MYLDADRDTDFSILGRAVFTMWVSDANNHWIPATTTL